jgi:hypothetical protein
MIYPARSKEFFVPVHLEIVVLIDVVKKFVKTLFCHGLKAETIDRLHSAELRRDIETDQVFFRCIDAVD